MPNTPQDPRELAAIATRLGKRVEVLSERLSVSQRQVIRMRWLTWLTAVLAALAVVGGVVSIQLWQGLRDTARDNTAAAVQACRNSNDSRNANRVLWDFVIDVSEANNTDATPKQRQQLERIRTWVARLYAAHDCTHLGKAYPLPPPPPILNDRKKG